MKQICVISGKGGTGKSSLTASLAQACTEPVVVADCDVDGANSALFFEGTDVAHEVFRAGSRGVINQSLCSACGRCLEVCRFNAIDKAGLVIDPLACEGCHACAVVCPFDAVDFMSNIAGDIYERNIDNGLLVHARLHPAQDNSGRLVSQVRKLAGGRAAENQAAYVWIDGPPGIGCPVHAALSGVDAALVVTEPSAAGVHDLKRIARLCAFFAVPILLLINKYDLNKANTIAIERFAQNADAPVVGKIPFDRDIPLAQCDGKTMFHMNAHRDRVASILSKVQHFFNAPITEESR